MAITPAPNRAAIFNADYANLGEFVTDDSRVPYYNPPAEDIMLEPGEPVLFTWDGATHVMLVEAAIFPGETGTLLRYFVVDLPAVLSAQVNTGDIVFWDFTVKVVAAALLDITNGFPMGVAIWARDPNIQNTPPTVQGTDSVVAGTTASGKIRVMVSPGARVVEGAPLILNVDT